MLMLDFRREENAINLWEGKERISVVFLEKASKKIAMKNIK